MPPFPKPGFDYEYDPIAQVRALRRFRRTKPGRAVPAKSADKLLLATWNVANLGVQERIDSDYQLIAELMSWFDLVAVQEVNDNLRGIQAVYSHLPRKYRLVFSDASGNQERQAFVYDSTKVRPLEEVGRLSIPPNLTRQIRPAGTELLFPGFDRGPYLATFQSGEFRFLLANVHLFFGSTKKADIERRILETYAVAWWANRRRAGRHSYVTDTIPLGDFNLPKAVKGDPIYDALTYRGLEIPSHTSRIGSSIASDSHYDQIAFFPGSTKDRFTGEMNVFDFDSALFPDLYEAMGLKAFLAFVRYHISDHRPLWIQFDVG
ncbi:MAG: endonuclease/exonuclease/phosphatase family protein [Gaiellaceae bacterium]